MEETKVGKVQKRIAELKKVKEDKENGKIFCIPFSNYPKMATFVPGIVPGMITAITASSGVGKTQFTKAIAVREPLEYAIANNIKIKIFYFALEESKQEFIDSMICNFISVKCKIKVDILTLQGYREQALDDETMALIEENMEAVEEMLSNVEIIDSVYHPTGIYMYCRDYADKNGTHHYDTKEFTKKKSNGEIVTEPVKVYSHYEPNDPNQVNIVIVDHLSLLTPEKSREGGSTMTLHQTMAQWSTTYALKQITKHWNWAVVNVIQQEQSGEKEQFTNSGDSVQKKTEPSLAGFANNKEIQRDAKVVFGVYSPDRYGYGEYHGYNIKKFRDTFRAVKILKNRFSTPNKYIHFLFDGSTNRFAELPKADENLSWYLHEADKLNGRVKDE
jgi:replicative DNA helicase